MPMKTFAKILAEGLAYLLVCPALALWCVQRMLLGPGGACEAISQRAARWPGRLGQYMRRALLRCVLRRVGKGVVISFGTVFSKPSAELDDGVYIGAYCVLGDVRIGAQTLLADHICVPSGARQHTIERLDVPIRQQGGELTTIRIGADCWIGSGAIVLADVGDHAVVAAGSVVTRPVDEYAVVAGSPAKPVADRRDHAEPTAPPVSDSEPAP